MLPLCKAFVLVLNIVKKLLRLEVIRVNGDDRVPTRIATEEGD